MLGDKELLAVIESSGEVIERRTDLVADVGDEGLIEDNRLTRSSKRVEGPLLGRIEGRSGRCWGLACVRLGHSFGLYRTWPTGWYIETINHNGLVSAADRWPQRRSGHPVSRRHLTASDWTTRVVCDTPSS
jgi:hypothetical protein